MTLYTILTVMASAASSLGNIPDPWIAVIGTLSGAVLLKIGERWLNQNAYELAEKADHRNDIRELQERADKIQADCDALRVKYYALQEDHLALKVRLRQHGISDDVTNPVTPPPNLL